MLLVALWNFIMLSTLFRPAASFVARNSFQTLPLNMVSSLDSLPLTTRASNEQGKEEFVLDPLVVCGPSGVGKVCIKEYLGFESSPSGSLNAALTNSFRAQSLKST
jgi:hypothetical protein